MTENQKNQEESNGKIKNFFVRYGKVFIVFGVVVLLLVTGVVIATEVNKSRLQASTLAVEALEKSYIEFLESDTSEGLTDLQTMAEDIITRYSKSFAAQRSYLILGLLAENNEEYDKAAELFAEIANVGIESHLVEVALMRGYQNAEIAGNLELAKDLLDRVANDFPNGIQAPRALYNLGRLSENQELLSDALSYYSRLVLEFPASNWTSLAKGRIITLDL